ncbi:MAG: hypothetical protein WC601_11400 [Desulfotomaculaceae bacterium]
MDRKYSAQLICGHCGKKNLASILSDYSERDRETLTSPCGYLVSQIARPWGVGYSLSLCHSCDQLTLTRIEWHDDFGPQEYSYFIMYPAEESVLPVLPAEVKDAYLAARNFKRTDPETCAVYLHRTLELVCADRQAGGESICERIGDLAKKGEIPLKLYELASLAIPGKVGIEKEIEFLQGLCEAVFGYVYQCPALLERLTLFAAK